MREPSNFRVSLITPPAVRDDSSSPNAPARHSVGPYRDSRGALAARLIALGRELEELACKEERQKPVRPPLWRRVASGTLRVTSAVLPALLILLSLLILAWRPAARAPRFEHAQSAELVGERDLLALQLAEVEADRDRIHSELREAEALLAATQITPSEIYRHVRQTGLRTWEVDWALVERALAQTGGLSTHTRVIPHERDGRVVGVKVYGIRRGSMLSRLGLENGDLLMSVNGLDLASPDAALGAYARLDRDDAIFLRLERRRRERVHAYRLVRPGL